MIEVKGVNKSFSDKQVLFDINTVFETGKVNLIIGQSGQGKSVLAKSIVGFHFWTINFQSTLPHLS